MQGKHSKQISPTLQALKTLKQLSFLADSFPTFREPEFADTAFSVYLKKKYATGNKSLTDKQQWLFFSWGYIIYGLDRNPRSRLVANRNCEFWKEFPQIP